MSNTRLSKRAQLMRAKAPHAARRIASSALCARPAARTRCGRCRRPLAGARAGSPDRGINPPRTAPRRAEPVRREQVRKRSKSTHNVYYVKFSHGGRHITHESLTEIYLGLTPAEVAARLDICWPAGPGDKISIRPGRAGLFQIRLVVIITRALSDEWPRIIPLRRLESEVRRCPCCPCRWPTLRRCRRSYFCG